MAVHGGFFEVTGALDEIIQIEAGVEAHAGRLTASESMSLDLWLEMREEWIRLHTLEVLQAARAKIKPDPLLCPVCWNSIAPDQLRFKVWKTDDNGHTIERHSVHLYHVTDTQEI